MNLNNKIIVLLISIIDLSYNTIILSLIVNFIELYSRE